MFTGLPCWSHTFPVGQGILVLISVLQDATALSPLINSMSLSSPLALQWVQSTCYAKGLIPEYGIHTHSYPWIHQNKFFCLYFNRVNRSPLFIMESYSCTIPENPVLLLNCWVWKLKLHHQLECFKFKFNFNLNWLYDVNFDHLSERTLCVTSHIGHQFMLWYFNVHALGITNYKWETGNFGL